MTIAVGFFDGVHLGHQAILAGADCALTFENHPLSFLAPERAPRLIMPWQEKVQAIRDLGVKVTALEFTAELAQLSPSGFLERLRAIAAGWAESYGLSVGPLVIRCGENWRFGKGGAGDAAWLAAQGIKTEVVPYAEYEGEPISSTRIRQAIEAGELTAAAAMLGRPYTVQGRLCAGKGLGRSLGYPTLNLKLDLDLRLPLGVYAVTVDGACGVANYGLAPTMGERAWPQPILEIHLLEGDIPGDRPQENFIFKVDMRRFLRKEQKFANLEELQAQIAKDCEAARCRI